MRRVLIDTDVILDFFFDRKPASDHAARVLALCETGVVNGFVTAVIVSNVYYLLRQVAGHDKVLDSISRLMTLVDVLITDKEVVMQALHSGFRDFEDALQNFSAEHSGAVDVVLTRNVRDYRKSSLGVMTPEAYLKGLGAPTAQ